MPKMNDADGGGAGALFTFTVTEVVAVLPPRSRATAVTVCWPSLTAVESQLAEYGWLVSSAPTGEPSTLNCTPASALLSDAFAASETLFPDTVALAPGAVSDTVGAVLSTAIGIAAVLETSLLFVATAASTWGPSDAEVESHEIEYGKVVSGEPMFTPSSWNCTFLMPAESVAVAVRA